MTISCVVKRLAILFLFLSVSCNYFETKKLSSQEIAKETLQSINWNDVDEYPSFSSCDAVSGKTERKQCFESTILSHVNTYLAQQHIVVSEDVADTIQMKLRVDREGKLTVLRIEANKNTRIVIRKIDSLLEESIATLPKIFPAIKRNQQVTTEFVLPVVVSIQ